MHDYDANPLSRQKWEAPIQVVLVSRYRSLCHFSFSNFETNRALSLLRIQASAGVFCSRCGLHTYDAWLIDRRETIKLYLACVALYVVLIAFLSG